MTCSVTGCRLPVAVKRAGLCDAHYQRRWIRRKAAGLTGPRNKLTPDQVIELRRLHAEKVAQVRALEREFNKAALAQRFGVHVNTVDRAIRGETWPQLQHGKQA